MGLIGKGKSGSVVNHSKHLTTEDELRDEVARLAVDKAEILTDVTDALYQLSMGLINNAEELLRKTTRKHI